MYLNVSSHIFPPIDPLHPVPAPSPGLHHTLVCPWVCIHAYKFFGEVRFSNVFLSFLILLEWLWRYPPLPSWNSFELQTQSTENDLPICLSSFNILALNNYCWSKCWVKGKYKEKWLLLFSFWSIVGKNIKNTLLWYMISALVEVSAKGYGSRGGSGLIFLSDC